MFGKLGELQGMMKQAAELGRQMKQMHEELAHKTVEASVGAGLVKVTANGRGEMVSIQVDPELMKPEERETLQELILAAVNESGKKAKDLAKTEMAKLTGGIDIPGMMGLS